MSERIEEGSIAGSIDTVSIDKFDKLLDQMKNYICTIKGEIKGTGFFCRITYENKHIPVLMTNYHVIGHDFFKHEKNIIISINNNKILIKLYLY